MRSSRHRPHPRLAGFVLLVGAAAFLVISELAAAGYPGFNADTQPLSRLGNVDSPTRWLWAAGLLTLASSWVVGAAAVLVEIGGPRLLALNVAPAIGLVVAVAVPLDANLAVHEVAAFSAFVAGIVAMLVNASRLRQPWRLITLACTGPALSAMSPLASVLIGLVGWGTLERLVVLPLIASLVVFGLALSLDERALVAARPSRRASVLLPLAALLLALAGVGTGLTAGGTSVVAAELDRHLTPHGIPPTTP
jgi:hypothetical membrane protein